MRHNVYDNILTIFRFRVSIINNSSSTISKVVVSLSLFKGLQMWLRWIIGFSIEIISMEVVSAKESLEKEVEREMMKEDEFNNHCNRFGHLVT